MTNVKRGVPSSREDSQEESHVKVNSQWKFDETLQTAMPHDNCM